MFVNGTVVLQRPPPSALAAGAAQSGKAAAPSATRALVNRFISPPFAPGNVMSTTSPRRERWRTGGAGGKVAGAGAGTSGRLGGCGSGPISAGHLERSTPTAARWPSTWNHGPDMFLMRVLDVHPRLPLVAIGVPQF